MERPSRPRRTTPVEETQEVRGSLQETIELPSEFDYEKDLSIDPNYLDAEFLNHSIRFMKYAQESAKANKAAKIAEENVKTVRSIIINEAKKSDVKYTESTLEAHYRTHDDYIKAKDEWIEATFYADLCTNAVFAMQARKTALENLVRLHGQEYFSNPQEPRDLAEASQRLAEIRSNSAVNSIKDRLRRT